MAQRGEVVAEVAARTGTPAYVYFLDAIDERIAEVTDAFQRRLELSYAVKSNPHTALLRHLRERIGHLDVSSGGEVERALAAGWAAPDISFTGPGKKPWEIEYAVTVGVGLLIVESAPEMRVANEVAERLGRRQRIAVRIGPSVVPRGFGMSMSGRPSQFGVDEELLPTLVPVVAACKSLDLVGFHVYAGTQCLSADTLVENFQLMATSFERAVAMFDIAPTFLVFGSGFGIPYYADSTPLDLPALAERLLPILETFRGGRYEHTRLLLELGRYLVGEAGVFAMSVIDVKESRGRQVAICDGGMHQHLGAAGHLGTVVPRNYRMFKAGDTREAQTEAYEVVGPLCTSIDTLGRNVTLPVLNVGDIVGVECSGAYGPSVSPTHFISHPPPVEVFVRDLQSSTPHIAVIADERPHFAAHAAWQAEHAAFTTPVADA